MSSTGDLDGYGWLDTSTELPGALLQVASCFYFFEGLRVEDVAEHAHLRDVRTHGPVIDHDQPVDFDTAIFDGGNGWTVAYQDNGDPDQYAHDLVEHPEAGRAVIVYWNVNARTEFSYWEYGERVVFFDAPTDRAGSDPDRLLADMNDTVVPQAVSSRTVGAYYAGMLALAERITGIHLGPDFLNRSPMLVGFFEQDGNIDNPNEAASTDRDGSLTGKSAAGGGRFVQPGRLPTWASLPAEWDPRERRSNKTAVDEIPADRSADLPARIARHACESVRIADRYPIDEILDDLEHGRYPGLSIMGAPWDLYTRVESAAYGGALAHQQVWAAIQALFAAAEPHALLDPLEVLLWARIAANDHDTRVVDDVKAHMGLVN